MENALESSRSTHKAQSLSGSQRYRCANRALKGTDGFTLADLVPAAQGEFALRKLVVNAPAKKSVKKPMKEPI